MSKRFAALLTVAALSGLAGCETPTLLWRCPGHDRDYDLRVVFSDSDRRIIRDYYREDYRRLPPGLAKKERSRPATHSS